MNVSNKRGVIEAPACTGGALHVSLRNRLRVDVAQVLHEAGATALMVTHDPEEALVMADHVAVMRSGHIEQFARRREIYLRPANEAVARILGDVVVDDVQFNGHDGLVALATVPTEASLPAAQAVARWSAIALPEVGATVGVRIDGDAMLAVAEMPS